MAILFAQNSLFLSKNPTAIRNGLKSFVFSSPSFSFSASSALPADYSHRKKWRQPVLSGLELGGVKIAKDDVVRDDPTNNVPDSIFSKLGMQLHRRDQHPLGIPKNAIFNYFDTKFPDKIDKFDDLCQLVTTKQVLLKCVGLTPTFHLPIPL